MQGEAMNLGRKKDVDLKYAGKWVFYFVLIGIMSGLGAILFHLPVRAGHCTFLWT